MACCGGCLKPTGIKDLTNGEKNHKKQVYIRKSLSLESDTTVKKFFIVFRWNFLSSSFCLLPLVLLFGATKESLTPSSSSLHTQTLMRSCLSHLFSSLNKPISLSLSSSFAPLPQPLMTWDASIDDEKGCPGDHGAVPHPQWGVRIHHTYHPPTGAVQPEQGSDPRDVHPSAADRFAVSCNTHNGVRVILWFIFQCFPHVQNKEKCFAERMIALWIWVCQWDLSKHLRFSVVTQT